MAVTRKMFEFVLDMKSLATTNDVHGLRRNEKITAEILRMMVQEAGGSIVLESVDWGMDRVLLIDTETWTGPDDSVDHLFCVAYLCMDGHLSNFSGPYNINDAHAQWATHSHSELTN